MIFPSNKLLTVREIAEALDVTPQAIYKWVKQGMMPQPLRLGGPKAMLRWRPDVINDWLVKRAEE